MIGMGVIFLIAITLGAMFYFNPAIFNFANPNTTLSISQIYVDPQGSEVGNEWRGSFWNILAYINTNDDLAGVILPEDQKTSITYQGATEALKTGAKIEIKIDPQQPYLIRGIQEKTATVTPTVGQTYVNRYSPSDRGESFSTQASELPLRYYGWVEPTWRVYTPYVVSIYKDGALVGQATLNTNENGKNNQGMAVSTSEGSVRIENLGYLSGQYLGGPNAPAQIAIFKGYSNVYDYTQLTNIIQYNQGASYQTFPLDSRLSSVSGVSNTFCAYWYGSNFVWTSNKHPAGIVSYGTQPSTMISPTLAGPVLMIPITLDAIR